MGRRSMFASLFAGGAVAATPAGAHAASSDVTHVLVSALRNGDLVVGPEGAVVRIYGVKRSGSRYLVRAYSAHDTSTYWLKPRSGSTFPAGQRFVVLLRKVPASAMPLTAATPAAAPTLIDGGRP